MNRITLVCGAPGSGKSRYVASQFRHGRDLICDYDRIMAALSDQPEHHGPRAFHFVALAAVEAIHARLAQQRDGLDTAWIIACLPGERVRSDAAQRLGANEIVLIQTPEVVCIERVAQREARADGVLGVTQWFSVERAHTAEAAVRSAGYGADPTQYPQAVTKVKIVKGGE